MEKKLYLSFLFCVLLINVSAESNHELENLAFSFDLLNETIKVADASENIIISPLSIQTCLALAYIGAEGKTAEELSTGLRLCCSDKEKVANSFSQLLSRSDANSLVKIANKIYVQNGHELKPEFNQIAEEKFNSKAENIDFKNSNDAAKSINKWVEEQTNQKIKKLVDPSNLKNIHTLLVNAIYFKGEWENNFDPDLTQVRRFYNDEENFVDVDMMTKEGMFKYVDLEDLDAKAIKFPYKNSDIHMLVILPNSKTGLKVLEKNLENVDLAKIEKKLQFKSVSVEFPKFITEFSLELDEVLKKLGVETMFSDNADFSHMTDANVKVDSVYHKAVIEVNEGGTEAAAATSVGIQTLSFKIYKNKFKADRPFLYFIKDENVVYFMGKVAKL